MAWNQENCLKLINEYKARENLWNIKHIAYYNRHQKEASWQELAEQFESTVEELKRKIESLKGSFRREKARTRKRVKTKNGEYVIYKSRWFAFKTLQFLNGKDEQEEQIVKIVSDEDNEVDDHFDEESDRVDPKSTALQTAVTQEALGHLRKAIEVLKGPEDESSIFGEYVAGKLRGLDRRVRAVARHRINKILYDLEMEGCDDNSSSRTSVQDSAKNDLLHDDRSWDRNSDPVLTEELDLSPKYEPPHSPTSSSSSSK